MKAILENPFRIVGLLIGATAKEQAKQINRLKKYIEAEQEPEVDFSFPLIGELNRSIQNIDEAVSKINLDTDKLNAALFWFWNGKPVTDEVAFEAIKDGNIEKAQSIWEKLIIETNEVGSRNWKEVTERNFSAFHNSSVLSFVTGSESILAAVLSNILFIESPYFDKFVNSVVDGTYVISRKEIELTFLNTVLETVDKKMLPEIIKYLGDYEYSAKEDFLKIVVQKPIEEIELSIETAKNKRRDNKLAADKIGQELVRANSIHLKQIKTLLGSNDLRLKAISDKLAHEILQCGIDYFNESHETKRDIDYFEPALKLASLAQSIALGGIAKERIKENIATIEEMKNFELSEAIGLLQSIKNAYEEACKQIDKEVDDIRYGPQIEGLHGLRFPKAGVSINWSKVEEMKRNCLDWAKVTAMVIEVIPKTNMDKIKRTTSSSKIEEYKSLVTFILSKIDSYNKSKIVYICYWETVPKTTSTSPSRPTTSTTSTSNGNVSQTNNQSDFEFGPNAWWIFGIIGLIVGASLGEGGGAIIGAIIGAGIGSKFNN